MSFYTFTTANLTTAADRRRRPAVSAGQLARALGCFLAALLALVFVAERGHAAEDGSRGFFEGVWVQHTIAASAERSSIAPSLA